MNNRQGFRGYVTSREFGGYSIPVPVQSLVLRDYCSRKGLLYVLPVNENIFPHSYLVLDGLIQNLKDYEGVVMCSMHMLPQRAERRREFYQALLDQKCSLHMVLEEQVVATQADVEALEELLLLNAITARTPPAMTLE